MNDSYEEHSDIYSKFDLELNAKKVIPDITDKIHNVFLPVGVPSIWVILPPAESLMIFTKNQKPQTYNGGTVKDMHSGFEIDLDKIFK